MKFLGKMTEDQLSAIKAKTRALQTHITICKTAGTIKFMADHPDYEPPVRETVEKK